MSELYLEDVISSRFTARTALVAAALFAPCVAAGAQCPDGSAPPCRGSAAPAVRRAVTPPLDENTWIVVPFDNISKSEDAEWLRGASVNLLYLDMSRWRDIKVVDDERVADLIRETPEAGAANTLSLNAGLAVAKRAGAGKLVMGDVLKLGNRTTVTAKIYDVKSGQRTRSVREDATVADSVMPLFGKLAQKILNVAPPAGATLGAVGTSRVDAYQAYLAGVTALNRFDLPAAKTNLGRAIALDSGFALAHYKMAIVVGWDDPSDQRQRFHAEAAARSQATLPARVRGLIAGLNFQARNEWSKACETYSGLAKADTADVEALYGVGECLFHDPTATAIDGDTTRLKLNSDWQGSIRAFERVLALDPQYHLAYQHIIDALTTDRQVPRVYCNERGCRQLMALTIRIGDSLTTTPVFTTDSAGSRIQSERFVQTRSRVRNLAAAQAVAEQWLRAAPDENRAQAAIATVMLAQGRLQEADAALARVRSTGSLYEELRRTLNRMEIAYKLGRLSVANHLYDSARATPLYVPGSTTIRWGNAISQFGLAFGRLTEFDSLVRSQQPRTAPPQLLAYQPRAVRSIYGLFDDSLAFHERAMFELLKPIRGAAGASRTIAPTLSLALRLERSPWPELDTTWTDVKARPAIALMLRDTTRLRAAARSVDSTLRAHAAAASPDTGFSLTAAEAYLALRDTAAALRVLRFGLDSASAATPYFPLGQFGNSAVIYVPRMLLMRADLAAATGAREEARIYYQRFVDALAGAAPELQPMVERARKARAALGT
jgi:tetratricopeptide (TPR) repeat protein